MLGKKRKVKSINNSQNKSLINKKEEKIEKKKKYKWLTYYENYPPEYLMTNRDAEILKVRLNKNKNQGILKCEQRAFYNFFEYISRSYNPTRKNEFIGIYSALKLKEIKIREISKEDETIDEKKERDDDFIDVFYYNEEILKKKNDKKENQKILNGYFEKNKEEIQGNIKIKDIGKGSNNLKSKEKKNIIIKEKSNINKREVNRNINLISEEKKKQSAKIYNETKNKENKSKGESEMKSVLNEYLINKNSMCSGEYNFSNKETKLDKKDNKEKDIEIAKTENEKKEKNTKINRTPSQKEKKSEKKEEKKNPEANYKKPNSMSLKINNELYDSEKNKHSIEASKNLEKMLLNKKERKIQFELVEEKVFNFKGEIVSKKEINELIECNKNEELQKLIFPKYNKDTFEYIFREIDPKIWKTLLFKCDFCKDTIYLHNSTINEHLFKFHFNRMIERNLVSEYEQKK